MKNQLTSRECWVLIPGLLISLSSFADASYDECLLDQMRHASSETTLIEVRKHCEASLLGDEEKIIGKGKLSKVEGKKYAVKERIVEEDRLADDKYVILPHKPNYILPVSYNSHMRPPHRTENLDEDAVDNTEVKFQVSLKARLIDGLIGDRGSLYVGYTSVSWWQAYNNKASAPFREINHEPEVWAAFRTDYSIGDWNLQLVNFGFNHQSNGRDGGNSRSWNRIVADFIFENGPFYLSVRPWYRLPEDEKKPGSSKGDDNPDLYKYMGYGELSGRYQFDNEQAVTVMLRNNLESENKGAVQVDYTFPIPGRLKGYVQFYNGYGESLIDYDNYTNRLSVGVMLTDWL
ncbi:phospholipase A1 [Sinobacterium caligoides]|uniref:Phospholipase A1 n=1 Tax=Sinobacterium caligoides TaxID=933926 RepID=A0A3N2DPD8_9GAMM|nr:phospholipase A [Sinobacterium caligoides]ROS01572.1 phospholipase A1 [Sinobacterium caligoides]